MISEGFFFLRPQWLLLTIPLTVLVVILLRRAKLADSGAWQKLVDPHLLNHLAVRQGNTTLSRWLLALLAGGLLAAVIAMAGPTWQKNATPSYKPRDPVVIVLSLAQSMNASDLAPSRLIRASHKVRDILARSKGGDVGFIVYSDRPFVAAPLTSDVRVIEEMLSELSPDLMPVLGNRLDFAITEAGDLLTRAGARAGQIIVISDDAGTRPAEAAAAAKRAVSKGFSVSVLGAGTPEGADLQTSSGRVIRDINDKPMLTRLAEADLARLASAGSGRFVRLSPGNSDIDQLLTAEYAANRSPGSATDDLHVDTWNDMGYWLLFVPVLLAPLAFRRGVLMVLPLTFALVSMSQTPDAEAAGWTDFWQTPDQQAARIFEQGDFAAAAAKFENREWKASALYKAGRYDEAATLFSAADQSNRDFNLGNALAHTGEFEKALDAYDDALKSNPADADAKFNRELVAKILERQRQQQQQQQKQDQQDGSQERRQNADQGTRGGKEQSQAGNDQQNSGGLEQQKSSSQAGQSQGGADDHAAAGNEQQDAQQRAGSQRYNDDQQSGSQTESADSESRAGPDRPDPQQAAKGAGESTNQSQQSASALSQPRQETSQAAQNQSKPDQGAGSPDQRDESREQQTGAAPHKADSDGKTAFRKAMDAVLQGNGDAPTPDDEQTQDQSVAGTGGLSELDQSHEQQLRAVPDDASGLLRARIRHYYMRLRGAQQNG